MTTKINCDELERILEQQDDTGLPRPALAHIEECEPCRFLVADLTAIRDAGMEMGAEELPVPDRVWISLRNQIDAENLATSRQPAVPLKAGWWTAFQRPALAGAFLSLVIAAAGLVGYQSCSVPMTVRSPLEPMTGSAQILSAEKDFQAESKAFGKVSLAELRMQDAAVTDSFRRNLRVVDEFISLCENSVREQPDNQMAREYLYGAYEQKAELLATAMNRNVTGGLQ